MILKELTISLIKRDFKQTNEQNNNRPNSTSGCHRNIYRSFYPITE